LIRRRRNRFFIHQTVTGDAALQRYSGICRGGSGMARRRLWQIVAMGYRKSQ
jgi:hypothetical protein